MPTSSGQLTLQQFHEAFDGQKPYFEFRRGQAIQKAFPTRLHSLLQRLMVELLERAGYESGQEIELRVSADWCPVPDVLAHPEIEDPYPTTPVTIVVEILSPADTWVDTLEKCADYQHLGVEAIFVLDPVRMQAWRWQNASLDETNTLELPNGRQIALQSVWEELGRRAARNRR